MSGRVVSELGESVAKLRALLSDAKKDLQRIQTLQDNLTATLDDLWETNNPELVTLSTLRWKEFLSLAASGRILSLGAQAEEALTALPNVRTKSWISNGPEYARWLGRGVISLSDANGAGSTEELCAQLCGKAMGIGYPDDVVEEVTTSLAIASDAKVERYQNIIHRLAKHEQRQFLFSTLSFLSKKRLSTDTKENTAASKNDIAAYAKLISIILSTSPIANNHLFDYLTRSPHSTTALYRAILATLALEHIERILERNWQQFGDKLYIKHTPIAQQEAISQILLLSAGYIHRAEPTRLRLLARASTHTSAISERLGSNSTRVRFLGMVVGMAVSKLVDKAENRLNFDLEEMDTDDAKWYMELVNVQDSVGNLQYLRKEKDLVAVPKRQAAPKLGKGKTSISKPTKAKIIEVVDGSESEDDDLVPYAKPDSDASDEEADATLVDRNKPTAPVYIRTLVSQLSDTSNAAQHTLSLSHAATLIRRKADFGSELSDRTEELARVLLDLHDLFDTPQWHEMRLAALVALVVAQPRTMGPWLAAQFFGGDYSLAQRATALSALGMGARELAGYKDDAEDKAKEDRFPSKRLPERLHKLYSEDSEINRMAKRLEDTMMTPVKTTSTRKRTKVIRNDLSKIVAELFFFPLTGGRLAQGRNASKTTSNSPYLLPLYLKTLSLILTSAGPATPSLAQMVTEFWDLTLSVRAQATKDVAALEAVLFAFLTILNVSDDDKRKLAVEHGKELVETHEWVNVVFDNAAGGDEEAERCRTLAAGVLVATKEIIESYQRLLIGEMADI